MQAFSLWQPLFNMAEYLLLIKKNKTIIYP